MDFHFGADNPLTSAALPHLPYYGAVASLFLHETSAMARDNVDPVSHPDDPPLTNVQPTTRHGCIALPI